MICFKIENYRKSFDCYSADRVYDYIIEEYDGDEQEAIEASSWCELAYVGEVYKGDGYTITVEEE